MTNKEGSMSDRVSRRGVGLLGLLLVAVASLAVSGSAFGGAAQSCGDVTLNENSWTGSTSNVYVAKYVLETRLNCDVTVTTITEGLPAFQAMADGKVDVVLEDWDNTLTASNQKYLKNRSVRLAGKLGITGVIGWYIPRYVLKQNPSFATWRGLKGKETLFRSPESGSQGMFLGGDPSYVQKDRALIKELGLNFKHVVAGAEPAQVARWTQLYKQRKPVIFYWYDPQYLNATYDVVRVKLPKRFAKCVDDEKVKGNHACEYPSYGLDKLISGDFATSGSPALKFIRKFNWTSADQNNVSNLIAGKKMKPDKAAETWVKANRAKVNAWLK
jgi:glycine betaine/proline transport system substrate-binding protein